MERVQISLWVTVDANDPDEAVRMAVNLVHLPATAYSQDMSLRIHAQHIGHGLGPIELERDGDDGGDDGEEDGGDDDGDDTVNPPPAAKKAEKRASKRR